MPELFATEYLIYKVNVQFLMISVTDGQFEITFASDCLRE